MVIYNVSVTLDLIFNSNLLRSAFFNRLSNFTIKTSFNSQAILLPIIELLILSFVLILSFSIFASSFYEIIKHYLGIEKRDKEKLKRLEKLCIGSLVTFTITGFIIYVLVSPYGIEMFFTYFLI